MFGLGEINFICSAFSFIIRDHGVSGYKITVICEWLTSGCKKTFLFLSCSETAWWEMSQAMLKSMFNHLAD